MRRLLALVVCFLLLSSSALADIHIRLTFAGDVTLGSEERKRKEADSFVSVAEREGYAYFFSQVQDVFAQDDLTIVNLEGPLTNSNAQENKKKTFRFRGLPEYTEILKLGSVEVVNFSNNHVQDFGTQGYNRSTEALDGAGIGWFGGQNTYIFEKDGVKIAFFGFNSTIVHRNKSWLKNEIQRLKRDEGVDAVVVCYHAGREYAKTHHPVQTDYAEYAIDNGADLVVMHHAHVIQGMNTYKNRSILYSLGNFCFGGNKAVKTEGTMASMMVGVDLHFTDQGVYQGQQLVIYPCHMSGTYPENNYQPHRVSGEEALQVMEQIQVDTPFQLPAYTDELGYVQLDYLPASEALAQETTSFVVDAD